MEMMRIDTTQPLVIFPKAISTGLILGCMAIGLLGAVVLPMGWADENWTLVVCGAFLALLGFGLAGALIVKRSKGHVGPTATLAPDGLHLHQGMVGLVPWRDVERLGNYTVKGTTMLLIHVTPEALARLEQSRLTKATRSLDTALGLSSIGFHQQSLEIPLSEFVQCLHQYSIAHGGPALQDAS